MPTFPDFVRGSYMACWLIDRYTYCRCLDMSLVFAQSLQTNLPSRSLQKLPPSPTSKILTLVPFLQRRTFVCAAWHHAPGASATPAASYVLTLILHSHFRTRIPCLRAGAGARALVSPCRSVAAFFFLPPSPPPVKRLFVRF